MNPAFNIRKVGFSDVAVRGNDAWVCNIFFSALFHMDLITLELTFVAILPTDDECGFRQYGPIEYYNGKLIIAPQNADKILIYDLERGEVDELQISDYVETCYDRLFGDIFIYNDIAYFFPGSSHAIIKLNLTTLHIEKIDNWYEEIKMDITEKRRIIFFDALDLSNGVILLPCWQSGKVVLFDMKTDKYKIYPFPQLKGLSGCVSNGKGWLMSERDDSSLFFCTCSDIRRVEVSFLGFVSKQGFRKIYIHKDQAYLFPLYGNMILTFNLQTDGVRCLKKLPMEYNLVNKIPNIGLTSMLCCKKISEYEVLYYSVFEGKIVKFNLNTNKFIEKNADLKKNDSIILEKKMYEKYTWFLNCESGFALLKRFLNYIQADKINRDEVCRNKNIGKRIYKILL